MERDGAGGAVRGTTRGRLRLRGMVSFIIFYHRYINYFVLGPWQKDNKVGGEQGYHGGRCK